MRNTNKLYKIIFKDLKTNKTISIEINGKNKDNAIYNARNVLMGYTAAYYKNPIYKSFTEVINIEILEKSEEPLTLENSKICPRCEGTGYLPKFIQYNNGVCYTCFGYKRVRKLEQPVVKELD